MGFELFRTPNRFSISVKQKDVHHFYVQMNRQGCKDVSTITGLFQSNDSPLTPYVINIQHVKYVAPRDK